MKASRLTAVGLVAAAGLWIASGHFLPHESAESRLRIPLRPGLRSINVAQAGALVLGEGLRQTNGFPHEGLLQA